MLRARLILIALAMGVIGFALPRDAQARGPVKCTQTKQPYCTMEEARAECEAYDPLPWDNWVQIIERRCVLEKRNWDGTVGRFNGEYIAKRHNGSTTPWTGAAVSTDYVQDCSAQPGKVTPFFPPSGSMRCMGGCEVTYRDNGDDTTTYSRTGKICDKKPDCAAQGRNMVWNAALGVCQPVEPECPQGKVKVGNACADEKPCPDGMALVAGSCKKEQNECPAGMIRSPLGSCIPGDGQCASGEVRGADGTCKRDKNGDGQPDTDDPESFSGGDTCKSPPSCSGSPIMCGQARIQWRIDCNTRRNNNVSGGHCSQSGMPVCTGEDCKAMEYASLLMQWRSACAAEKLLAKDNPAPGANPADKNGNGVADALEGVGEVTGPGDGASDVSSVKKWGIGVSTSMIDTSDMFGGGSCPQPPSFSIMGTEVSGADFPYFCQLAAIMRGLILIFAAYAALRILMGGNV
ncbi:TPA: virulence factor TspB C-terminal domain-related protein [Stenotrophomonas maltophilia]